MKLQPSTQASRPSTPPPALEERAVILMPAADDTCIPAPIAKLDQAWKTTQAAARVGLARADRAMRFGTAAVASPFAAPIIGNEVAGLFGAGLGASLGLGKLAEFMVWSGRCASEAAWMPPWMLGEAMFNVAEAAFMGLTGAPPVASAHAVSRLPQGIPARPKVLVVSLSAGGGHDAAARAIQDALDDHYDVSVVKPYDDGVEAYNAAQQYTPGHILDLFGYAQRITDILNQVVGASDLLYAAKLNEIMEREQPAIVISTVPMENATTLRAAQRHGVPMVIVPTDLDFAHFAHMVRDAGDKFKVLLPFAHTRDQVAHLPDSAVAVTGYPVRRAFTVDGGHEEALILRALGIEADHKVAMIMMGARGSVEDAVVADAEALARALPQLTEGTVHVAVMCGSNETLRQRLGALAANTHGQRVRIHAVDARDADDMATLMNKAAILVTKPGGSTVNEALAANLPMLFHSDVEAVHWELGNARYAVEHGMAQWVGRDVMPQLVADALARGKPKDVQPCPSRQFPQNLRGVVGEMLRGAL